MKHELDHDACCIHCGHDGAEEFHLKRLGYSYPPSPCPVWDQGVRERNRRRYSQEFDDMLLDAWRGEYQSTL